MDLNIKSLIDDERCFETIRNIRWLNGLKCPHCEATDVIKRGKDDSEQYKQRYECKACSRRFDDLSNTVFAGHHQPLKIWVLTLYFMGLNLSNNQIAQELELNKDDMQYMTEILRTGVVEKRPQVQLSGEVEFDEVYVTAGHKGNPLAVKKEPFRQKPASQSRTRTWYFSKRKASNLWCHSTFWGRSDSHA